MPVPHELTVLLVSASAEFCWSLMSNTLVGASVRIQVALGGAPRVANSVVGECLGAVLPVPHEPRAAGGCPAQEILRIVCMFRDTPRNHIGV